MKKREYVPSRELFSKCVKAGSRFYYIDAKQDSSGSYYMVMSESRANSQTGERERQRIFVYQEDVEKFVEALGEVAAALTELALRRNVEEGTQELASSQGLASLELPDVEQFLCQED